MKKTSFILCAALCMAGCVFTGCNKSEEEDAVKFEISQKEDLKIDASEQTITIDVAAPAAWDAKSDESWAVVTTAEKSFRISVSENEGMEERFCTISATCGDEKLSFALVQAGAPEIFIVKYYEGMDPSVAEAIASGDSFPASGAGEFLSFVVEHNLPLLPAENEALAGMGYHAPVWTYESKCDWIEGMDMPNMILNEYQISISVAANTTGASRTGSIDIVSTTGKTRITINVEQGTREFFDNIFFNNPADWGGSDPASIMYCVNGNAGVEYYTGIFEKEDFQNLLDMNGNSMFLSFIQCTGGFMAGSGPIYTVSEPGQQVSYIGTTPTYFMDMMGGVEIAPGYDYYIIGCDKASADDNDEENADFHYIEYSTK